MILRFLKQSYAAQYVFVAFLVVVLWVPSFVYGPSIGGCPSGCSPLYDIIVRPLIAYPYLLQVVALLLLTFEAFFFNSFMVSNQLITRSSTLGAVCYILFMSLMPWQMSLQPILIASLFVVMLIHTLSLIYQTEHTERYLFNGGVFLAVATMFYFPSVIIMPWALIALFVMGLSSLRTHLIFILGFLVVYFVLFSILFLVGDITPLMSSYHDFFSSLSFSLPSFDLLTLVGMSLLLILSLMPFERVGNSIGERSIAMRKRLTMIYVLLPFALLLIFLVDDVMSLGLILLVTALLFSYRLSYVGKTRWIGICFALFIVGVIALQYYNFCGS